MTPPRTIAIVPKNSREEIRIELASTHDGPRLRLNLYRKHGVNPAFLRCLGSLRPDVLGVFAEAIQEADRLLKTGGAQ